jgi:hypothetical protein
VPNLVDWAKRNPWTVAGIIGALIVLYLLYQNSTASSATTAAVPQADPNQVLAADTALQQSQMQLQAQTQQLQYQLAGQTSAQNASVAVANIQAQLGAYQTFAGQNVSLAGIQAQENVQEAGLSTQEQIAQINADTNQAQIAATEQLGAVNAATYAHIADVNAGTIVASYNAATAQAQIASNTTVAVTNAVQETAQKSSSNNLFGSIVTGIAGIFSDENLKLDVQTLGYDEKGRRWVSYRYLWDEPNVLRTGVIAQEILKSDPKAVRRDASGYLRVKYGMLQ